MNKRYAEAALLSFPMHGYSTGTMSFESFSEVVFQFRITPVLVAKGLIFSIVIGLAGSLLPALRRRGSSAALLFVQNKR